MTSMLPSVVPPFPWLGGSTPWGLLPSPIPSLIAYLPGGYNTFPDPRMLDCFVVLKVLSGVLINSIINLVI